MTLLFMEGFDMTAVGTITSSNSKWDLYGGSPTISSGGGPFGTNCVVQDADNEYIEKNLGSNEDVLIVQFWMKHTNTTTFNTCLHFLDGTTDQCGITVANDLVKAYRTQSLGTLLGAGSRSISEDVWHYYEVKVTFHGTTGSILVHIDGSEALNLTNIDTIGSANNYANRVRLLGDTFCQYTFDDLVVMNDAGSANNDFIGTTKVETLFASSSGTSSQFTPSAGSNYQNIDDDPGADGDTTYNAGDAGEVDLFTFDDLSTTNGIIAGMQISLVQRVDDAGSPTVKTMIRSGGTNYSGTSSALSASYEYYSEIQETDPDTGIAWVISGVNSAEFGYLRDV